MLTQENPNTVQSTEAPSDALKAPLSTFTTDSTLGKDAVWILTETPEGITVRYI